MDRSLKGSMVGPVVIACRHSRGDKAGRKGEVGKWRGREVEDQVNSKRHRLQLLQHPVYRFCTHAGLDVVFEEQVREEDDSSTLPCSRPQKMIHSFDS
jgi:hypothetical protein